MRSEYLIICRLVFSILLCGSVSTAQAPEAKVKKSTAEAFEDGIHYLRIAKWELAKGNLEYVAVYGDPIEVLALAQNLKDSEKTLLGALNTQEVAAAVQDVLKVLEQGRAAQQQNPELIEQEIVRLGTTPRGRLIAKERLTFIYKEYAVPQLLRALADNERANLHASIVGVLSEMGKSAVDPLVVALAIENQVVKGHIIWSLGKLGYRQAAPYLQEIVEDNTSRPEIKQVAQKSLNKLRRLDARAGASAAKLYYQLANDYYYGGISKASETGVKTAKVWFFRADIGPTFTLVPGKVYNEIMTMRSCQRALELDPGLGSAVSLWLGGALQMEAKLGTEKVAFLGENWPGANWFVVTAGQRYLQEVLARAEKDGNAPVALGAVQGLDLTAGRAWLSEKSQVIPLANALRFPDKRVRIAAAFSLARAFSQEKFIGSEGVVPTLCEAVRQTGGARAVIMDVSRSIANKLQGEMRELGYDTLVATSWDDAMDSARASRGLDLLVVGVDSNGDKLANLLGKLGQDFSLASTAVVLVANEATLAPASDVAVQHAHVEVLEAGVSGKAVAASHREILLGINQKSIDKTEADEMALTGAKLIVQIALRDRKVYDINIASDTLIKALHDPRTELVKLALQGLSLLEASENQRAIADYALDAAIPLELRLIALERLGESARLWGNQLGQEQVGQLMKEVLEGTPSKYHSKVAQVVGTLNLPSEIIKELILRKKH